MSEQHTKLHFALLKTDSPMPELIENIGHYHEQFDAVFDKAAGNEHLTITWDLFDVIKSEELPSLTDIKNGKYDALLLTGSDCSADGNDPWILKLLDFLKNVQQNYVDKVKLIGICFGHQVMMRAAGATSEKNDDGWEIGWTEVELNDEGRKIFKSDKQILRLNQFHQDHVPVLPKGFKTLASTHHSPNQIVVSENGQCISVQGHPEFDRDLMRTMIKTRMDNGALDEDLSKRCLEQLASVSEEMEDHIKIFKPFHFHFGTRMFNTSFDIYNMYKVN
ncbi:unnamed protein product [Mucor hiemalis]